MKLLAIGDNVVDVYMDKKTMYPGGNALNVAVMSKEFGAESSAYIGIVGNDSIGDHIVLTLQQKGIDISRVRKAAGTSGQAFVDLNEHGDRLFIHSNKGGIQQHLSIRINEGDIQYINDYDVLHTSIYSNLNQEIKLLSENIQVSYDFSNHYEDVNLGMVCPYLTFAFLSGSHLDDESIKRVIDKMHKYGTKMVIVTRGENGVMLSDNGNLYYQDREEANVIDTLGAGDSFISAFLMKYTETNDIELSLKFGVEKAARTCEVHGAFGCGKDFPLNSLNKIST